MNDTFNELFKVETKQLSARSCLGIFVRFDIALIVNQHDGKVSYFVNEVERTQSTTLWSNRLSAKMGTTGTGILGYTLAEALCKWVSEITDPFGI
jgi:hypothetical protein